MKEETPKVLLVGLVPLGIIVVAKLLMALKHPLMLIDAGCSAILFVGLYLGQKWAYYLTIVFVALGTFLGVSKNINTGLIIFLVNCVVLVPALMSKEHFFEKSIH